MRSLYAHLAELVDARDLKSLGEESPFRFESGSGHFMHTFANSKTKSPYLHFNEVLSKLQSISSSKQQVLCQFLGNPCKSYILLFTKSSSYK